MPEPPGEHCYHAYLLRLWSAVEEGQLTWRASLENPRTGERIGFASLQRLFAFLLDQTSLHAELNASPPTIDDDRGAESKRGK